MKGTLIVIEGLDGSGKQTQANLLKERLEQEGRPVKLVSFPDYAQPSSELVKLYLAGRFGTADEVPAYIASSFYTADRFASYVQIWRQDYLDGKVILADRYTTSNIVHQMSKLPRAQWDGFVSWLEDFEYNKTGLPRPDRVIYLDMPPEVSKTLIMERYAGDASKKDIHEQDFAYLMRCREAALFAVEHYGWERVACAADGKPLGIAEIAGQIGKILKR